MPSRSIGRVHRYLLLVAAVAFTLTVTPLLHAHELACAHDTSFFACNPAAAHLGPGDTMDKGDAAADFDPDAEPGEPGPMPAMAADAGEFVTLGNYDPQNSIADVWAHKRVAYLASWRAGCRSSGVEAVSLRDPANPTPLSRFADAESNPELAGTWTEKVIVQRVNTRHFRGDLAAVSFQPCSLSSDAFRGFGVYDVSDPTDPVELALVPTDSPYGVHELWLEARPNAAYVYTAAIYAEYATRGAEKDFMVFDVSEPGEPVRISEWGITEELGIDIFDGKGLNFVHSVIGDGRRAYLSYWDMGTVILDLRDPANPVYEGNTGDLYRPEDEGNAHSAWLAQGGNVLIQTEEDFSVAPQYDADGELVREQAWGYPRFYDISNPTEPVHLADFELPTTRQLPPPGPNDYTVHDPKVRGNTVFFSWYAEGIVAVDIAGIRNGGEPTFVAQWKTPTPNPNPIGPGERPGNDTSVWGVALDGDLVLASDRNSGLYVLRLQR
ncbi:LVIVD repeat-containing protein [Egicoccus sp. AB-alg2]|uniref:LVIVD repeat-containing protein n=1 Tax=Egicoccus sp. AB-alg2 TaxID=3242693 RepID=UPI00359D5F6F